MIFFVFCWLNCIMTVTFTLAILLTHLLMLKKREQPSSKIDKNTVIQVFLLRHHWSFYSSFCNNWICERFVLLCVCLPPHREWERCQSCLPACLLPSSRPLAWLQSVPHPGRRGNEWDTAHPHKQHTPSGRRMWLNRWLLLYHSEQTENVMWVHKQREADVPSFPFESCKLSIRTGSEENIFNSPSALLEIFRTLHNVCVKRSSETL